MYNKKVAVLCNGPSRSAYNPDTEYAYRIGCNIPWTQVDCTVVLDEEVVRLWHRNHDLINVPTYFSVKAWRETASLGRAFFEPYLIQLVEPRPEYDSSGHVACSQMIKLGYTDIDIYGCDSWFTQNVHSYTHKFVKSKTIYTADGHVIGWRKRWNEIIKNNPSVTLNFIEGVPNV
jgi:hypothetical protein